VLGVAWPGDQTIAESLKDTTSKKQTYVSASSRIRTCGSHVREDRKSDQAATVIGFRFSGFSAEILRVSFNLSHACYISWSFIFDLITRTKVCEEYKAWTSKLCDFSPSTYYFFFRGPNIVVSTLLPHTQTSVLPSQYRTNFPHQERQGIN